MDPVDPPGSAQLLRLDLGAPLEPEFSPEVVSYALREDQIPQPIPITAFAADPHAEIALFRVSVADGASTALGSYDPGASVALAAGERLELQVTSGDRTETRTYRALVLPSGFPEIEAEIHGEVSPGDLYLGLITPVAPGTFLALTVDAHGVPTWYRHVDAAPYDLRLGDAGAMTYVRWDGGVFLDAMTREPLRTLTPPPLDGVIPLRIDVHELFELADGTVYVLGNYVEETDLTPYGGPRDGRVVHHAVQELAPNGEVTFSWSTEGWFDYEKIPFWVFDPEVAAWEYAHLNSVSLDPDDGNLVVSVRIPSQVVKVARHPTEVGGRSFQRGEVIWRLGGPDSAIRFVGDDRREGWQGFAGQHTARPLPGGRLQVFDNALWRVAHGPRFDDQAIDVVSTGRPRMVEYAVDPVAGTAVLQGAFETEADPIRAGGSVQRLDGGHTLIGWGDLSKVADHPAVTEVDADGTIVRELWLPAGQWSYRAWLSPVPEPLEGGR